MMMMMMMMTMMMMMVMMMMMSSASISLPIHDKDEVDVVDDDDDDDDDEPSISLPTLVKTCQSDTYHSLCPQCFTTHISYSKQAIEFTKINLLSTGTHFYHEFWV
ncbi:hypothetical protein E2C01_063760 [Portunus trituberculatus]|uniref:Uncharacterized protein n=1 Tax=Portunus trituberculatus TaxID=210409 RepID=A0A5B7HH91_PORTR|nr:hypothetical protein [Portunus trituberculatus]